MDAPTVAHPLSGQDLANFDYRTCICSDIVPVCLLPSEVPSEYTPEIIVSPQDGTGESLKCSICDRIALSPVMRSCGCLICCRCEQNCLKQGDKNQEIVNAENESSKTNGEKVALPGQNEVIDTLAQKFCTIHGEVYGPAVPYESFPRSLLKLLSCTLIRCPFEAVGCVAEISLLRYQEHIKNCPYSAVRCPYCLSPGLRDHFADTHFSICTCLPAECPVCKQRIAVGDLSEHMQQSHPICEFCKQLKSTPHDSSHTVRQCGVGGCVEVVARCQFNSHLRDAAFSHIHCDRLISDLSDVRHELDETYIKLAETTAKVKILSKEASLVTRLKKVLLNSFREKERCLIVYGSSEVSLEKLVGVLKISERVIVAKHLLENVAKIFNANAITNQSGKVDKNLGVILPSNIFIDKALNTRIVWPTRSSQVPEAIRSLQTQGLPPHIIAIYSLSLLFDGTFLEVSNIDDLTQICLAENDEEALNALSMRESGSISNTKYGHPSTKKEEVLVKNQQTESISGATLAGQEDWVGRSAKISEMYGFDNRTHNTNTNSNNGLLNHDVSSGDEQTDAIMLMSAITTGANNTNDNWEKIVYERIILSGNHVKNNEKSGIRGITGINKKKNEEAYNRDGSIESRLNDPAIFAILKEIGVFMSYLVSLYTCVYHVSETGNNVGSNNKNNNGTHKLWPSALEWMYSVMFKDAIKFIISNSAVLLPTYDAHLSSLVNDDENSKPISTMGNNSHDDRRRKHNRHDKNGESNTTNDINPATGLSDIYGFNINSMTGQNKPLLSKSENGQIGDSGLSEAKEMIRNALKYGDALGLPIAKWTSNVSKSGTSGSNTSNNMIALGASIDNSQNVNEVDNGFHSYYLPSAGKNDIIDPEILDSYDFVFYTPTIRVHKIACYAFKQCLPSITGQFNPTAIVMGPGTAIMYLRNLIPRNVGSITFESNRSYNTDEGVAIADAIQPCSQNLHEINLISHTYDVHAELNTTALSEALADSVHSLSTVTMTRQRLGSRMVDSLSTVLADCYCLRSLVFDDCEICPLGKLGQAFVNLSSLSVLILKLNAVDSRKKLFDADLPRFLAALSYLRSLNKLVINLNDEITISSTAAINLREALIAMQNNLLHLEMCQCGIKFDVFTIIMNALEGMKRLKILRLDSNPLFVNEPDQFISMVVESLSKIIPLAELSLIDTRIGSNNITSLVDTIFSSNHRSKSSTDPTLFDNLQILRLDRNRLRDDDGKSLYKLLKLPNLALISFKYCKDFTVEALKYIVAGIQKESSVISEKLSNGKKIRVVVEIYPTGTEIMQTVGFVVKDGMYILSQLK